MVLTISRRINQTKTAFIVRSQLFLNMHWMLIYSYLFDCMYKTMKGHKESNRYVFRKWLAVSLMDAEEHFMSQQWRQPHYVEWCNVAIADESDATLTVHNDYLGSGAQEAARRTIHIVATIRVNDCTVHSCWRGAASASACYFTLRVGVDSSDIGHSAPLPSLEINNAICWLVSSSGQLFSQLGQWFMFNISDNSCWQRSYIWHTNILEPPTRCAESMSKNHGPLFQGSRIKILCKM